MQVEFKYKNKDSSRRDRAAEQLFTCGFVQAVVDRLLQQPQFLQNCAFSYFSSARRSVSSATRHSACLLARRDVRVPLLSHAMAAISCFSGSGEQRLLQRMSTGTGEPSSKRHPVHCAKMSHRLVVAQPGSLKQSVNLTCSSLTTCLDKRNLSNLTQARRQQNRI